MISVFMTQHTGSEPTSVTFGGLFISKSYTCIGYHSQMLHTIGSQDKNFWKAQFLIEPKKKKRNCSCSWGSSLCAGGCISAALGGGGGGGGSGHKTRS